MSEMMMRWAQDEMHAMDIANAVLKCGGRVVSIAFNGQETHYGALAPHSRFIVFAEVRDKAHMDEIDAAAGPEDPAAPATK